MKVFSILFIFLLISSFIFSSISEHNKAVQNIQHQGTRDAKDGTMVHKDYLACYALGDVEKENCIQPLIQKYIKSSLQRDKDYTTAFQYEAEKLGFMQFLNAQNMPCGEAIHGPSSLPGSGYYYLVPCRDNNFYIVRFSYETKEWVVVK